MNDSGTTSPATDGRGPNRSHREAPIQPLRDNPSSDVGADTDRCGYCGTPAATQSLHLCTGCRQRKYCNRACQLAAWRAGHKHECKLLKADAETKKTNASNTSPAARTEVEGGGQPGCKNINTDPPDDSSAEPSNGPACADPDHPGPASDLPTHHHDIPDDDDPTPQKKLMKKTGGKTMWARISKCFDCGQKGHDLSRCTQCEEAFYCDQQCETRHAKAHEPVCMATVAAKARRAKRERVARAVREFGKTVEGAEEDALCVICQAKLVNPVEVRACAHCLSRVVGGNL